MTDRVGLFVIGVQKAGTTSLDAYLRRHPMLSGPREKETHFFDNEHLDWADPPWDRLHALYPGNAAGRLRFEATPISSFWPPALARIRHYNPAAKLILLLRDPIERAWSHWSMEHRRGVEPLSFSAAIRAGRDRLPADDPLAPAWREFSYVERGFYAGQLRRARLLFPATQILCLDAAALRRDNATTLGRIAAFAQISPFPALAAVEENVGVATDNGPSPDDAALLRALYRADLVALTEMTGLDIGQWPTLRDP